MVFLTFPMCVQYKDDIEANGAATTTTTTTTTIGSL
jgi:hypothetical protein